MLLEQDKKDIRRFLDYSAIGLWRQSPVGQNLAPFNTGFRMFNGYGNLEYKMGNLQPAEEATLTGYSYGAIGFVQGNPVQLVNNPQVGSTMTVTINSSLFASNPVTLNYTVVSGDTFLSICGALAQQAALNGVFTSAGFLAVNDFGNGPYGQPNNASQLVTMPLVSFMAPTGATFTLAVSGTGSTIPQIVQQGQPLNPRMTSNMTVPPTVTWGFLPILRQLEDLMLGQVSDNLSVYKANDAILRMSEMKDRRKLFNQYRRDMAIFLGLVMDTSNPAKNGAGGQTNWSVV